MLDWKELVQDAITRRKQEGLTQREHAALAGVSVPTIVAFDRGELTVTLTKAFDILRVVGLIKEDSKEGVQERFVLQAHNRWKQLTEKLPPKSPGRFPYGCYRIDYELLGDLTEVELHKFTGVLRKAVTHQSGWPPFWVPERKELIPDEVDGTIECWLRPGDKTFDRPFFGAAHCDFWRACPTGRAFLIRGYQEDEQETFSPGTIFDTTLAIWRLGEALLHAVNLSKLIAVNIEDTKVRFRAMYTGLKGRQLQAWANPLGGTSAFGGHTPRSDEVVLEITAPITQVDFALEQIVLPLVTPLYERFGVVGLSLDFVASELSRMRKKRLPVEAI